MISRPFRDACVSSASRSAVGYLKLTASALVLAAAALSVTTPIVAQEASAQVEILEFDMPAQSLNASLLSLADQAALQIVYDADLVRGLQGPALQGAYSPQQAMERLLSGTELSFRFNTAASVSIFAAPSVEADAPIEAGPLMIGGAAVASQRSAAEDAPFVTPGSTAYVSREQIVRVQPSAPGDIFREVPGVLSGGSNDGASINVNIRSSQGLNRVRTMVEGTQQESSGYQGYAGADQRTYIDPELIGGVEITKGPGGGPYSAGTTSGIVNVRLLDAEDLIEEGRSTGFRLRGGLGGNSVAPRFLAPEDSFNTDRDADTGLQQGSNDILTEDTWFGSVAGAYRSERFDLVAAYAKRREGNYFAGENGAETFRFEAGGPDLRFSPVEGGEEVPNTSEDTESLLFKGTIKLVEGQSIEAGYTYYTSEFGQVFPSSLNLFALQQFDLNRVESNRYWLRYAWESDNPLIDLQANLWGTNAQELGELRQGPQENEAWGAEIWNTSLLETGFGDLTVSSGLEYSQSDAVIDLFAPLTGTQFTLGEGARTVEGEIAAPFEGTRQVFGGYVNVELAPTDWLNLNVGLRYDSFDGDSQTIIDVDRVDDTALRELAAQVAAAEEELFELEDLFFEGLITEDELIAAEEAFFELEDLLFGQPDLFLDGFRGQELQANIFDGDRLSPRFGVTLEPRDGLQLFAQYSEGFRALSLVELGQTFNSPVLVNPDLEPEVVQTWEVGVNYVRDDLVFAGDAFRAKLVYYTNDYDNFVARTGRDGAFFFFENVPGVTVSGIETSLAYETDRAFVDFNFATFDEAFDLPTQASIDQPEYTGTLTVGTRWLEGDLELGGRVTVFGEPNDGSSSIFFGDEFFFWDSQEILDLFGSYKLNDTLSFGFSAENVADTYYVPPLFVSRIPAPGRTVRVNFTATF